MLRLTLVPRLLLATVATVMAACGNEPNTSITTDGTSTSVGSTGALTTGEPTPLTGTEVTSDATGDTLTGGQSGTASTGDATTTDATTGEQTSTATTFGTETATTATSTIEPETTGGHTTGEHTTGEHTTGGGFIDCPHLKADYQAELAELVSCADSSECGQELKGTSCGCTHNAVARLDADSTHLYELLMVAEEHGCELILAGTCDCPAAEGFECNNGFCSWNYL